MPIAGTFDLYESATHHGLMSSGFLTPFLYMIGMTSGHTNKLWRSKLMDAMRALLLTPAIHKKFESANGRPPSLDSKSCSSCITIRIRGTICGVPSPLNTHFVTPGGRTAISCRYSTH